MKSIQNGRFRIWSYIRPSGHPKSSGFLRGTSAPITEWAFALVDESARPELVYLTSEARSGFESAEAAVAAARKADWERSSPTQRAAAADNSERMYQRRFDALIADLDK
jgi:hypothetical protein